MFRWFARAEPTSRDPPVSFWEEEDMTQRADVERYRENWQDEVDSAAEYGAMAASEPDPKIAKVYSNLAKMEEDHIAFWEERLRSAGGRVGERRPSWRSRVVVWIARRLGPIAVLSTIAAKEAADRNVYVKQPETSGTRMSAQEQWHTRVLSQLR
jgi:vacuolar iron transporter family protein